MWKEEERWNGRETFYETVGTPGSMERVDVMKR